MAVYPYHDEDGSLLFEVVRFEPKGFAQRRPDGNGGHSWGLNGQRRVPYGLPEVLAAPADALVFVAEGEKDVHTLRALGLTATCNPGGAGKWQPDFNMHFAGRDVVVLADNDGPGLAHADSVARNLHQVAHRVRLVWLPGPEKSDVSDWLDAGHSVDELLAVVAQTPDYEPPMESSGDAPTNVIEFRGSEAPVTKSAAVRLVEVLPDDAVLFHAPDGTEYTVVTVNGHRETLKIKSAAFRKYLARLLYLTEGKAPSSQALHDAVNLICAQALYDGHEQEVYLRTAPREGGGFWLDLCDPTWSAIEVTSHGWRVVENPPVRFRRASGMLALPVPQRGGTLDELDEFVNVRSADDRLLLRTIISSYMRPTGPYVVLALHGEHGACKSSAAKVIRLLIDPSSTLLSRAPRDEHNLFIAANNGWIVNFDNLSRLDTWLSDALCCLATGGGLRTRELYSDDTERIFSAMRPVILNGIEACITRGDLADRAVTIYLGQPERRQKESEFWRRFSASQPRILGGLLDAAVGGLRQVQAGVTVEHLPRMADFCEWGIAVEVSLGFEPSSFLTAYTKNHTDNNSLALESSPVASAIMALMTTNTMWSGTATELLEKLAPLAGEATRQKGWPADGARLRKALPRVMPNLREAGIHIHVGDREGKSGRRVIRIERVQSVQNTVSTVSSASESGAEAAGSPQPAEIPSALPSAVNASKHEPTDSTDSADGRKQPLSPAFAGVTKPKPVSRQEDF
ncbi:MAG TPA: hypothetical protein VNN18_07690 [Candidatus Xenobia bacterium]|nr:hypothetical protein [Candidatus Xenobia bacterium]